MENHHKQRHGCVTAWLILMIIVFSVSSFSYLFLNELMSAALPKPVPKIVFTMLIIISLLNIIFAMALLLWKKWAFWGFAVTSLTTMCINLYAGFGIAQSLLGLVGFAILYGILQIREKNGRSAWENLE